MSPIITGFDPPPLPIEQLPHSEERFRALFVTSPVGIGLMGLDRKIIDVNPALCGMLGLTHADLIGRTPAFVTYPDDYPDATHTFEDLLAGRKDYYRVERRYVHKNGNVFWVQITMSVVRDTSGNPLYMVGMVEDIDEKKKVSARLEESEQRFRAIFENSAIGIGLLGPDRRPIEVNPATSKIFGYPREDFFGKDVQDFTFPEDLTVGDREFQELVEGKRESYQIEKRFVRQDGGVFWARLTLFGVYDQEHKLQYIVSMTEDITGQKKSVEALTESEARFRTIFENSVMGVVILDLKTHTQRYNSAARMIMDFQGLARVIPDPYDFIETRYREAERELFSDILAGKRDSYQTDHAYIHASGEPRWAHITISSIKDFNGKVAYIVATMEDITSQKLAQERLQESEARFRAMFNNTEVGMTLISSDRHVIMVNPAIIRMTGYSEAELIGITAATLTIPEDMEIGDQEFKEIKEGVRDSFKLEKRYFHKDGHIYWTRQSISAVRDSSGKLLYMTVMIEDIDQQRRAAENLAAQEAEYRRSLEERVEERTRKLREANLLLVEEIEQRQRAEDTLAAKAVEEAIIAERTRLAHDLHDAVTQTLFSASLIAEVLPDLWQVTPEEALKSIEELRQLTRGALAEMRTLLLELRPAALTQTRFPDLLKQLREAVIGRARLPVELIVEGDYELTPEVKVAFYRIAQESLNNIIKYSRATQVQIRILLNCCQVHLEIKDNGVGFDPAAIKPTSLGMRIMRERADAIHAHFKVSSNPGQGTIVSVDWNEDEAIPVSKILKRGEE
jgi:PAS domain S-box-containing protein